MERRKLLAKLDRVDALREGATTPGERLAATEARERILRRLTRLMSNDHVQREVLRGFAAARRLHTGHLHVVEDEPVELPTAECIADRVVQWRDGEVTRRRLAAWADRFVDKVVFPHYPPEDVRSIPIEVLLQLSCMRNQPLYKSDIPALLAFLGAGEDDALGAWHAWFAHVDAIDWTRRGKRRSA
jgi:hypothetical protein